jgi:long-chain acyl-CoA synthetase
LWTLTIQEKNLRLARLVKLRSGSHQLQKGYWNMPDATTAVFRQDGWFLTGDIGYPDEEGILYITDRKKDMIMSG